MQKESESFYIPPSDAAVLDASQIDWEELQRSPEFVENMVRYSFPDAPVMVAIARAESRFDPKAKNPHSSATGVFQILTGTWAAYGCTGDREDAHDNIACARKIFDQDGTTPWNASKGAW